MNHKARGFRLVLLSFFRDLSRTFEDLSGFSRDVLNLDLSSLFIVGEPPRRV
jgi:hypothetical protein